MSIRVQIRRGTAAAHASFVGAEGEVTMDTTAKRLRLHDSATAGGIPVARLDEISGDTYREIGNANVTLLVADSRIALNAALTAARTVTLPLANAVPAGKTFRISDKVGGINGTNVLNLARAGSNTINGVAGSFAMATTRGAWEVTSDGVSSWSIKVTGAAEVSFTPAGGIAATTVQAALVELDDKKQPLDATLTALAALTTAANKLIYATGADTFATADLSAAGRTLIAAANAAAQTAIFNAVVGDTGTGGTKGLVPAPAAGANAAGRVLDASGTFVDLVNKHMPVGSVVDCAFATLATVASTSLIMPFDDTKPQSSEGAEILSVSISPKSTTNRLRVLVILPFSLSGGAGVALAAIFRSGAADALSATYRYDVAGSGGMLVLAEEFTPGATSSMTLSVRIGVDIAGRAVVINGTSGPARLLGGASKAVLLVQEIKA